ncbi:MAG: hypothetical protein J7M38_14680 [Armatimonadetes bacterium]|nr:hypothetical protein [Armatimonadota bacterium]
MFVSVYGVGRVTSIKKVKGGFIMTLYMPKRNRDSNKSFAENNTFFTMFVARDNLELSNGDMVAFTGALENSSNPERKDSVIVVNRSDKFRVLQRRTQSNKYGSNGSKPNHQPVTEPLIAENDYQSGSDDEFDLFDNEE